MQNQVEEVLYHTDRGLVPSVVLSDAYSRSTRIALSLRNDRVYRLVSNGGRITKEGSVPLPASVVSLSVGHKEWITVSMENGVIAAGTWDELFSYKESPNHSRKRKRDEVQPEIGIFESLLMGEVEGQTSYKHSWFTELTRIPTDQYRLLHSILLDNSCLAGFAVEVSNQQLCLLLWKQPPPCRNTVGTFNSSPSAIFTHAHNQSEVPSDHCVEDNYVIPSLLVSPHTSNLANSTVVKLNDCLYSYLFGHEGLLAASPVLLFGWTCGCVLAVMLRDVDGDYPRGSPRVICSLSNQSIVSVYSCSLGPSDTAAGDNSLVFIGSTGRIVLFVSQSDSSVIHREVFIAPAVVSTLLVRDWGLVICTLDVVKKVCLKRGCGCSANGDMFHSFNTPLVIKGSPLRSLCSSWDNASCCVLGVDFNGRIVHLKLLTKEDHHVSMLFSASDIGNSMKQSLMSIQRSAETLTCLQHRTAIIDDLLVSLNETVLLFKKLSSSESSPFVIQTAICYEQCSVDVYVPQLSITLAYKGRRVLRKGVAIGIEVGFHGDSRAELFVVSKGDSTSTYSQLFPLEGLQNGAEISLKPKILSHFYQNLRLDISFWCTYTLPVGDSLKQVFGDKLSNTQIATVRFQQQTLSPLDFVSPVKNFHSQKFSSGPMEAISFNITVNSLNKITGQSPAMAPHEPLHPRMLSSVLTHSEQLRKSIEPFIIHTHDINGRGLELRAVCGNRDLLLIRLRRDVVRNMFTLIITSMSRDTTLLLTDEVVQLALNKSGQVIDYLKVTSRKVSMMTAGQDSAGVRIDQMQAALVNFFRELSI